MTSTKDRSPGHDSRVINDNVLQFKRRQQGAIQPLDADDPRNLNHPMQRAALIEFAKAIGRYVAEQEYERLINEGISIDEGRGGCSDDANSGKLRKVFN